MFDLFSNPMIAKAVEDVRRKTGEEFDEDLSAQKRFSLFDNLDPSEDEPGNNVIRDMMNGKLAKAGPERLETFDQFFDRRKPALHFLDDIARGQLARREGRKAVTVRDELFKEFQVEQRGKIAETQLREQNKQSAIRLAVQQKLEAQREKARLHRDEILNDMKKDLAEMRQEQVLARDEKKAEARMAEIAKRGEIQKDIVGFRADLQTELEGTKFDNREKLAESAFERAQKLVKLRSTLNKKDKTFVDSEVVETWTDLAEHGLVDRDKLMSSKLPAPVLTKVMKNVVDRDILLFPTATERKSFNDRRAVLNLVGDVNDQLFQLEGLFTGTGPNARLRGAIERAKASVGLNEELQAILQRIDSLGPTLARASGDRGNIAIQEQIKAIRGYLNRPGSTRLEGERVFEGAMVTILANIAPTLQNMQTFKRDPNDPGNTTTVRRIVQKARANGRDPIELLKESIKEGMNIVPSGI